jgi:hypothetical protein
VTARLAAYGIIRRRPDSTTRLTVTPAGVRGHITRHPAARLDPDGEPAPIPEPDELPTAA